MDMLIAFHTMSHQALLLETGQGVPISTTEKEPTGFGGRTDAAELAESGGAASSFVLSLAPKASATL